MNEYIGEIQPSPAIWDLDYQNEPLKQTPGNKPWGCQSHSSYSQTTAAAMKQQVPIPAGVQCSFHILFVAIADKKLQYGGHKAVYH